MPEHLVIKKNTNYCNIFAKEKYIPESVHTHKSVYMYKLFHLEIVAPS